MQTSEKMLNLYKKIIQINDIRERTCIKNEVLSQISQIENKIKNLKYYNNTSGKYIEFIEQLNSIIINLKNITLDVDKPFKLFIIGLGNAGKSSLINALLGQEVAPVSWKPLTWKIDVYALSENNNAIVRYADGSYQEMTCEKAHLLVQEEENAVKLAKKKIQEKKKEIDNENWDLKVKIDAKKKIEKELAFKTNIIEIVWPVLKTPFMKKFQLVDTPGLDQALMNRGIEANEKIYYKNANGIIWILPSKQLSDKSTYNSIKEIEKNFGWKMEQTIAVLNKIDLIDKDDPINGRANLIKEAYSLYSDSFNEIIPFSSKKALENIPNSGIEELNNSIRNKFYSKSHELQIDDMNINIEFSKKAVSKLVKDFSNLIENESKIFQQNNKEWIEVSKKEKKVAIEKMENIFMATLERIKENAEYYEDEIDNIADENEREIFLKNKVLNYDMLENDISQYQNELKKRIDLINNKYRKIMTFTEYKSLSNMLIDNNKNDHFIIDNSKTELDNDIFSTIGGRAFFSGILGIGAGILLGPLCIPIGLIGMSSIGHSVSRFFNKVFFGGLSNDIYKAYKNNLESIKVDLLEKINDGFDKNESAMKKYQEMSFKTLYFPYESKDVVFSDIDTIRESVNNISFKKLSTLKILMDGDLEK